MIQKLASGKEVAIRYSRCCDSVSYLFDYYNDDIDCPIPLFLSTLMP